jgi:N-acetylglucosamine-6-phosphate deacetylase
VTAPELLIAAPRVIPADGENRVIEPGYVALAGGVITSVARGIPPREPDITLPSGTLLPGFVDLQVNGYFGVDFQSADSVGWAHAAARLPQTGVTAFLPTFITAPPGALAAALRTAREKIRAVGRGARVLGVHAEGPFISPARKGAHNEEWITEPSPAAVEELLDAGQDVLRLVTLAPERDGALTAITRLTGAGIRVSVGHSDATAAQVARAADHGARMVTHLFNAQRPLHHREPGVVGQALTDHRLASGLITDMYHVSPPVCVLAFRAAPGRIFVVTDAAACAGMPPGSYQLGGEQIVLPPGDGEPPVRGDGTMAGSALRMDVAVGNLVAAGIELTEAVAAATRLPADLIGRPDLGRIEPGAAADLAWLDDDLRAAATWVGGELVFSRTADGMPAAAGRQGGETG